jgi:hypothetical protein
LVFGVKLIQRAANANGPVHHFACSRSSILLREITKLHYPSKTVLVFVFGAKLIQRIVNVSLAFWCETNEAANNIRPDRTRFLCWRTKLADTCGRGGACTDGREGEKSTKLTGQGASLEGFRPHFSS